MSASAAPAEWPFNFDEWSEDLVTILNKKTELLPYLDGDEAEDVEYRMFGALGWAPHYRSENREDIGKTPDRKSAVLGAVEGHNRVYPDNKLDYSRVMDHLHWRVKNWHKFGNDARRDKMYKTVVDLCPGGVDKKNFLAYTAHLLKMERIRASAYDGYILGENALQKR